jgi:pyrroloquinoline quinone (PQQ) biosynthesis protein C/quercetin dioxygenase-like cupin family protein
MTGSATVGLIKTQEDKGMNLLIDSGDASTVKDEALHSMSLIWANWLPEEDIHRLIRHPLLVALNGDQVDLHVLKTLLVQHSYYSRHFTRYLCAVISQLHEAADVNALLENMREEMGIDGDGELTHAEMFQRTLRHVGVIPADHTPFAATTALVNTMMGYCKSSDPLAGLAAMCLGAEAIVPLIYCPILKALQQSGYSWEVTEFFRIHIEEDEDHALTMLGIMRRLIHDQPARLQFAVNIGKELIDKRLAMFDAIWATRDQVPVSASLETAPVARFSSKDFGKVPSRLTAQLPQRLKHAQVTQTVAGNAQEFSNERKHKVHIVDLPTHTISMTIGGLEPGQSTRLHRHNYETVIYILTGQGHSRVGERQVDWQEGDAIYIPVWAEHQHVNTGDTECSYIACENAPLLQNLGGIAIREEIGVVE